MESIDLTNDVVQSLLVEGRHVEVILNPDSKEIEETVNENMFDNYCKYLVSLRTQEVAIWRGEIPYNIVLEQLVDVEGSPFVLVVGSPDFILGKAGYYEGKMTLQIVEEADYETEAHLRSLRKNVLWLSNYFSNINIYVDGYANRLAN